MLPLSSKDQNNPQCLNFNGQMLFFQSAKKEAATLIQVCAFTKSGEPLGVATVSYVESRALKLFPMTAGGRVVGNILMRIDYLSAKVDDFFDDSASEDSEQAPPTPSPLPTPIVTPRMTPIATGSVSRCSVNTG